MVNEEKRKLGTNRSCIRDLFEYGMARAAEIGRENVFDFSIGNPSVPAPAGVNGTIAALAGGDTRSLHRYTSAAGAPEAREAIAKDLNDRFACGARARDLFLTCGAAPALTAVLAALAVEDAETLIFAPFFPEYTVFAASAGMKNVIVPADTADFQIHAETAAKYLTEHTQAVIVNSPNNPSGVVYSRESLSALAALLEKKSREYGHPIYLISDEPYRELVYDGAEVSFLPLLYRNSIVCYSYSKSLSLPGERLGYIYVPQQAEDAEALLAAIAGAARSQGHVCAPSLLQHMIARCAALRPDIEAYDRNRRALYDALTAYGYECVRPQGAFYLLVRSPRGSAKEFSERAKAKELLIVPCGDFGCPDHLRISTCVDWETVRRSLPVFKELIEER